MIRPISVNSRKPAHIKIGLDGTVSMTESFGNTGKTRIQIVQEIALPQIGASIHDCCIRGNQVADRVLLSAYCDVGADSLAPQNMLPPTPISQIGDIQVPNPVLTSTAYAPALLRLEQDFRAETKPDGDVSLRVALLIIDGFNNSGTPADLIAARDRLWALKDANGDGVLTIVVCLDVDGMGAASTADMASYTGLRPSDLSGGARLCAELASPAPDWITTHQKWIETMRGWTPDPDKRLVFNPGSVAALKACLSSVIASSIT